MPSKREYHDNGTVTISVTELEGLDEDRLFLSALDAAGVDNWVGHGDAIDLMDKWYEGEDDAK